MFGSITPIPPTGGVSRDVWEVYRKESNEESNEESDEELKKRLFIEELKKKLLIEDDDILIIIKTFLECQ